MSQQTFGSCVTGFEVVGCHIKFDMNGGSWETVNMCDVRLRSCYVDGYELFDVKTKTSYSFGSNDKNVPTLEELIALLADCSCGSGSAGEPGEPGEVTEQILECLELLKDRKDIKWFGECIEDEASPFCGMPVVYCFGIDGQVQAVQVATPGGLENVDMSIKRGKVFDAGADFTPDLEKFVICHGVDDGPLDLAAIEAAILASGETWDNNDPMGGLAADNAVIRKVETRVLECGEKKADGTPVEFQGSNEQCAVSVTKDGNPYAELNGAGGESCEGSYESGGVEFDQVYTPNVDGEGNTAYIEACVTIERRYARSKSDGFGDVLQLRTAGEKSKQEGDAEREV